jgi:hypothetical protein
MSATSGISQPNRRHSIWWLKHNQASNSSNRAPTISNVAFDASKSNSMASKDGNVTSEGASQSDSPPPYQTEAIQDVDLTAGFKNMKLENGCSPLTADSCLAHLKLMFAIQQMKEEVGCKDGLWGLWDSTAGYHDSLSKNPLDKTTGSAGAESPQVSTAGSDLKDKDNDARLSLLSKIREKRWALFVARAVDRYEAWWEHLSKEFAVRPVDINARTSEFSYSDNSWNQSVLPTATLDWHEIWLPPLGKLSLFLTTCIVISLK